MDMFLMHVQGKFERPSRLVLDVPVWLDNLICQMLEKKPDQRPLNAKMVSDVLGSIQEKVEAQQSAGADAVRARMIDRAHGTRNPDEEDKDAARALMGKKGKRKKRKEKAWYGRVWFQAAGILAVLALIAGVLFVVLQPPDPHALYVQAKKLMESPNPEKHEKAYADDGPIKSYLARYASIKNDETAQMLQWKKVCDVEKCEQHLQVLLNLHKKGLKSDPISDAEGDAKAAALAEERGDLAEAVRLVAGHEAEVRRGRLGRRRRRPSSCRPERDCPREGPGGQAQPVPQDGEGADAGVRDEQAGVHRPAL